MTSELRPHGEPAKYFTFPSLSDAGLPHATTTRHCPGIASFAEPISPEAPRAPFRFEAAAILGGACLAIVFYDPGARILGLAHVGWRGTVRGATQAAVRAIGELGGRASSLRVAIAPSIGPCCYEVDEPVTAGLARAFGERWTAWVRPSRAGHVMLDLWAANEALLSDAGVAPTSIDNPRLCTACHPELLYSYRKGNRGRLVTVAALPSPTTFLPLGRQPPTLSLPL